MYFLTLDAILAGIASIIFRLQKLMNFRQIALVTGLAVSEIVISSNFAQVQAAQLIIPNTTVLGTDVFSGPSFTVSSNFTPSDTLSINVSGTVSLRTDDSFIANAAGILVNSGQTLGADGGATLPGLPYAALLIGSSTLGFFPLFAATPANGLNNPNPPANLSLSNVLLSSIFGNIDIPSGTILQFRVNDSDTFNNSGQFVLTSTTVPEPPTAVPEPQPLTILGGITALGLGVTLKRKLK